MFLCPWFEGRDPFAWYQMNWEHQKLTYFESVATLVIYFKRVNDKVTLIERFSDFKTHNRTRYSLAFKFNYEETGHQNGWVWKAVSDVLKIWSELNSDGNITNKIPCLEVCGGINLVGYYIFGLYDIWSLDQPDLYLYNHPKMVSHLFDKCCKITCRSYFSNKSLNTCSFTFRNQSKLYKISDIFFLFDLYLLFYVPSW